MRKTPAGLDWPIVFSEEITTVDDENMCTTSIMGDKDILKFVQSSKNITDADADKENEINNVAPVPTSPEMRIVMKSARKRENRLEQDQGCRMNDQTTPSQIPSKQLLCVEPYVDEHCHG
ncbi:hypothetical protein TNCV_4126091 [Trichonephila clavipes]|nr:hypothetical protein TNCV_4126091 [Trichonephila clavipes]